MTDRTVNSEHGWYRELYTHVAQSERENSWIWKILRQVWKQSYLIREEKGLYKKHTEKTITSKVKKRRAGLKFTACKKRSEALGNIYKDIKSYRPNTTQRHRS